MTTAKCFPTKGAAIVLGLVTALSAPASAQEVSAAVQPAPMVYQATPVPAAQLPERFNAEIELRIAELHRELRITPQQEPLFRAYEEAMRANAQAIHAMFVTRAQATDFSAPARLRWFAQATAARADGINRLIAPFDALYQSLSPEQRLAADRHFERFRLRRMPGAGR